MTEIEKKALELVRDVADGYEDVSIHHVHNAKTLRSALCRVIEQHEAFRQEVSDAAEHLCRFYGVPIVMQQLERFIIPPKPDPLVDAIKIFEAIYDRMEPMLEREKKLRAELAKRGGRIVFDD